jgi:dTDP-4-dehydrorhamnose reductase
VIVDRIGAPTTAELVVGVTTDLVMRYWCFEDRRAFPTGLYHLAASGQVSWHGYAVEVLTHAQAHGAVLTLAADQVEPILAADYLEAAPRPINSCLDTSKLWRTFGIRMPDWKVGVHRLVDQLLH